MPSLQEHLDNKLQVTAAIDRLIKIALRDTGQSRRVANFLLAWWNADDNGGFDPTDLWNVDSEIAADIVLVFAYVATHREYANNFGYGSQMNKIFEQWRLR
jgi:hypothetical protein